LIGNFVLGQSLFFICKKWAESIQSDFPLYLSSAIWFPYAFWIVVGVYRSGKKHGGLWGWVAIILSIFGAMADRNIEGMCGLSLQCHGALSLLPQRDRHASGAGWTWGGGEQARRAGREMAAKSGNWRAPGRVHL
jgi:hypothetical protein